MSGIVQKAVDTVSVLINSIPLRWGMVHSCNNSVGRSENETFVLLFRLQNKGGS